MLLTNKNAGGDLLFERRNYMSVPDTINGHKLNKKQLKALVNLNVTAGSTQNLAETKYQNTTQQP